jgi:excisionase family DNA binding protein
MEQLKLTESNRRELDRARRRSRHRHDSAKTLTRDDILSAEQVAELLQLRQSTVEDYARRGVLPSIKLGRHRRFVRADIEAALAQLRKAGG